MSVIAYIRKSTDKQSFEHQEYEIKQYAQKHNLKIDRWVEESISSRKELKKRQLGKLLLKNMQQNFHKTVRHKRPLAYDSQIMDNI